MRICQFYRQILHINVYAHIASLLQLHHELAAMNGWWWLWALYGRATYFFGAWVGANQGRQWWVGGLTWGVFGARIQGVHVHIHPLQPFLVCTTHSQLMYTQSMPQKKKKKREENWPCRLSLSTLAGLWQTTSNGGLSCDFLQGFPGVRYWVDHSRGQWPLSAFMVTNSSKPWVIMV